MSHPRGIMSGYFMVADVGCILSGLLVARLAHRGWRVEDARKLGYLAFSLLAACASLVPFAGDGALMVALLLAAGAGILGLHPYYYAFTQELSARRMGTLSGALAAWGWVASSLWQIRMGALIEQTRNYGLGLVIVGHLVPFQRSTSVATGSYLKRERSFLVERLGRLARCLGRDSTSQ